MAGKLSFSIAVNLLTENFKKGTKTIKDSLRSMQMQIITFAAALGASGFGLSGLVTRMIEVARSTSRAITALKNVSGSTGQFANNLRFVNDMAKKYGLEVTALTGNFAKFTASATQANMPMEQQKKVFESLSRASTAFGLSADDTNGVFLALSQMMGKGKISSEELRKQMGERLPIALQAMAKAAGVSIAELEKLMKQGKLMSADIIPKFADALTEMLPNVDTNNLETSLNKLSNTFGRVVESAGVESKYKSIVDKVTSIMESAADNIKMVFTTIVAAIVFLITASLTKVYQGYAATGQKIIGNATATHNKLRAAIAARVEAENALETAKANHAIAQGNRQLQAAKQVASAERKLRGRVAAEAKAHETAKAAAAQAAAIKSKGAWASAGAMIVGTFKKIGLALKSMWNSFGPAIIISGLIELYGHFKNIYDESKRIKNIFSDYKKEVENIDYGQEVVMLQRQLAIMNDKTKGHEAVNAAQAQLNKMLGVEGKSQTELNKLVAKRIELLKEAARADYFTRKIPEIEDRIKNLVSNSGLTDDQAVKFAKKYPKNGSTQSLYDFEQEIYNQLISNGYSNIKARGYQVSAALGSIIEIAEQLRKLDDANAEIEKSIVNSNKLTSTTTPTTDPDKTADRRVEAKQWLLDKLKELQNEQLKLELDNQQKILDAQQDGYNKQIRQNQINYARQLLEISNWKEKISKEQQEVAERIYIQKNGSKKGFNFSEFNMSLLPASLQPANVTKQVDAMTNAAIAELNRGKREIDSSIQAMMASERMAFKSQYDQQLSDNAAYYKERRQSVKVGSDEWFELLNMEARQSEKITQDNVLRLLELEKDYREKEIELATENYLFQTDKDAALLQAKIKNNAAFIAEQKKLFRLMTKEDYDSLDSSALNSIAKKYPDLVQAIKTAILEQKSLNGELEKLPSRKLGEVVGLANKLTDAFGKLTKFDVSAITDAASGISDIYSSFGALKDSLKELKGEEYTKKLIGGSIDMFSTAANVASVLIGMFTSNDERRWQVQKELNKLQQEYNISLRQQNADLISSVDYVRAFRDNLESLHWLIEKGFISDVDYTAWDALSKRFDLLQKNIKEASSEYDSYMSKSASFLDRFYNTSVLNNVGRQIVQDWKNSKKTAEDTILALERLKAIGVSGPFEDWIEALKASNDEITNISSEIADLANQMDEFATGTGFDSFLGDAANAIKDLRGDISGLADFTENTLSNAVLSSFKYQILSGVLKEYYDQLAKEFTEKGVNGVDKNWADNWKNRLAEELAAQSKELDDLFDKMGIDSDSSTSSQQASSGYSVSMNQDTGEKIEGRLAGVQISGVQISGMTANLVAINESMDSSLKEFVKNSRAMRDISLKSMYHLEDIAKYTKVLPEMAIDMKAIRNNTNGI